METMQHIGEFLRSDQWTEGEKWIIKWQYRMLGDFQTALAGTIKRADDDNLQRLGQGFPDQVSGFIAWNRGDLATRLREAGLDI